MVGGSRSVVVCGVGLRRLPHGLHCGARHTGSVG